MLNGESNFCYGEGGAGTWSDGKLTTRIGRNSEEVREVLGEWSKARQALRSPPSSWMDGIEPGALCHILFSVEAHERWGDAFVRPRCKCCHVASRPHQVNHVLTGSRR